MSRVTPMLLSHVCLKCDKTAFEWEIISYFLLLYRYAYANAYVCVLILNGLLTSSTLLSKYLKNNQCFLHFYCFHFLLFLRSSELGEKWSFVLLFRCNECLNRGLSSSTD